MQNSKLLNTRRIELGSVSRATQGGAFGVIERVGLYTSAVRLS